MDLGGPFSRGDILEFEVLLVGYILRGYEGEVASITLLRDDAGIQTIRSFQRHC